jgi:hypothetical protein
MVPNCVALAKLWGRDAGTSGSSPDRPHPPKPPAARKSQEEAPGKLPFQSDWTFVTRLTNYKLP